MDRYVVDTHILIWYFEGTECISTPARLVMDEILNGKAAGYVSAIAMMEALAVACKKGWNVAEFCAWLEEHFVIVPVTAEQVKQLPTLFDLQIQINGTQKKIEQHDGLLIVLARELDAPLVTKDRTIRASGLVRTIW